MPDDLAIFRIERHQNGLFATDVDDDLRLLFLEQQRGGFAAQVDLVVLDILWSIGKRKYVDTDDVEVAVEASTQQTSEATGGAGDENAFSLEALCGSTLAQKNSPRLSLSPCAIMRWMVFFTFLT